jgi:hypothetical protein
MKQFPERKGKQKERVRNGAKNKDKMLQVKFQKESSWKSMEVFKGLCVDSW